MCIICRGKASKRAALQSSRGGRQTQRGVDRSESLVRLVSVDGELTVDRSQTLPGRGAYVHQIAECIVKLGQIGRVARALRVPEGALSVAKVREVVEKLLESELLIKGSPQDSSKVEKPKKGEKRRVRL